jgi:hypothetical protein
VVGEAGFSAPLRSGRNDNKIFGSRIDRELHCAQLTLQPLRAEKLPAQRMEEISWIKEGKRK